MLRLAERLGDVSEACRRAEVSRDAFYRWRRELKARGEAALERTSRRGPLPGRRVPPALEAEVLALTRRRPELEKRSVAVRLDFRIKPTAVRSVWLRNGVGTTRRERVAWAAREAERPAPRRQVEVECPACHRPFAARGAPPFTCSYCGVGGITARVHLTARPRS